MCYSEEALQRCTQGVEFLDVGCGYGGLLSECPFCRIESSAFVVVAVGLSREYPNHLSLGMEIRVKVSDYVQERITALRQQARVSDAGKSLIECNAYELRATGSDDYGNVWCLRMNAMKYLPNFFRKAQVHLCSFED